MIASIFQYTHHNYFLVTQAACVKLVWGMCYSCPWFLRMCGGALPSSPTYNQGAKQQSDTCLIGELIDHFHAPAAACCGV